MPPYRVFILFSNGAYINSICPNFHEELNQLIVQFGKPVLVELRGDEQDVTVVEVEES